MSDDNSKIIAGCKNGYTKENINKYFYESEESQEVCNSCPHLVYKNGMLTCNAK